MSDFASSLSRLGDCKTHLDAFCTAVLILFSPSVAVAKETCRAMGMEKHVSGSFMLYLDTKYVNMHVYTARTNQEVQ